MLTIPLLIIVILMLTGVDSATAVAAAAACRTEIARIPLGGPDGIRPAPPVSAFRPSLGRAFEGSCRTRQPARRLP
jgi:hypothetical protein